MFLFKKIVSPLFCPLTLCLLLMIVGLVLLWFRKKGRSGKVLLAFGVLMLTFFSYGAVADRLIAPLECRYPPIDLADAQGARWVAVLGAGAERYKTPRPALSRLTPDSLTNLTEGVRLHRNLPGSKLLLSGGVVFGSPPEAEVLSEAARELGVDPRVIRLETASKDTEEQARVVRDIVGNDKCVLVTSTCHMPRALALFKKAGVNAVAAPAGPCTRQREKTLSPSDFYPSTCALIRSEKAFHEYLGILWSKLRGKI